MTSHEHCKSLKKPSYKWAYKFQVIYQATQKLTWLAGKSSFVVNDWSFPLSCYLSRCVTPGSFGLFSPSERVIANFKWDYSPYRYGYFTPVTYLFSVIYGDSFTPFITTPSRGPETEIPNFMQIFHVSHQGNPQAV